MSVRAHLLMPQQRGFSLIEVMIVVAIVAIIAAVGYPSYTDHVRKGRRVDAQTVLVEMAQALEQHYARNNDYGNATTPFSSTTENAIKARTSGYYTVTVTASGQSYTISAVPSSGQDADKCGSLFLYHTGKKEAKKGTTVVSGCWD